MCKSKLAFFCLFCALFFIGQADLPAQKKDKKTRSSDRSESPFLPGSVGEINFQFSNKLIIKNSPMAKKDLVVLAYKETPPQVSLFFIAPLSNAENANLEILADIQKSLMSAYFKGLSEPMEWIRLKADVPLNKNEYVANLLHGRNQKKSISIDFRLIKFNQKHFVVGLAQEQCFDGDVKRVFDKGELCRDNFFQLIYLAQIVASVTGEEMPFMWPPLGGGVSGKIGN